MKQGRAATVDIVGERFEASERPPLLEVTELVFRAGRKTILDGLSISVGAREIHALVGSNGTGKSTLAYLIVGSAGYVPTAGRIVFAGTEITHLPMHARARLGIALAWQEPARIEGLPVSRFLALGRRATDPSAYLSSVGLDPTFYLDRMLDKTLSSGERKRIEIAAVAIMQPKLAILDEPTAGIDMLSIREIAHVIETLKQQGSAVLLITHREEIARIADKASYLCGGRIVHSGETAEVVERYKSRRCIECNGVTCR